MTDPRSSAFATELSDLLSRYSDVPPTERWFHMTLAGLAITDAAKRQSTDEAEWLSLCRMVFRRVRKTLAGALTSIVLVGCGQDFQTVIERTGDASSDAAPGARSPDAADAAVFHDADSVRGDGSTDLHDSSIRRDVSPLPPIPAPSASSTSPPPARPLCSDADVSACSRYCQGLLPCCIPDTGRCGCQIGVHCSP